MDTTLNLHCNREFSLYQLYIILSDLDLKDPLKMHLDRWLRFCPEPAMLQHASSDAEGHLPAVRGEITE